MKKAVVTFALAITSAFTHLADAHTPRSGQDWWQALDSANAGSTVGAARGVIVLRAPASGRVRIPGGTFLMGSTASELDEAVQLCRREIEEPLCASDVVSFLYETIAHDVTLSSYSIDRTEASVAAYDRCVAANACTRAGYAPGDKRFDRPELPVTMITWDQARAYCAFAGGRLPTEAEWEFAARGEERRIFPWGDVYNSHLSNHGVLSISDDTDASDGYATLAPVDAFRDGATPQGVLQMAGNVYEWVSDFFGIDPSGFGYPSGAATNPTGQATGFGHVVRGGSYAAPAAKMRGAARQGATGASPQIGVRCAYGGDFPGFRG